jgi:hypothetical protein
VAGGHRPAALIALLGALPAGTTELGCHPGLGDDSGSAYGAERDEETRTLCDPRVRAAIEALGISLASFGSAAP